MERAAFSDPWSLRSFTDLLRSEAAWFAVLESGGDDQAGQRATPAEIDGFVIALRAADEAEIANIAVRADQRGRGSGARLLDAVLADLDGSGVAQVFLEVRASNLPALRLYERRGFVQVGRRSRYYRSPVEDALVFRRPGPREAVGGDA